MATKANSSLGRLCNWVSCITIERMVIGLLLLSAFLGSSCSKELDPSLDLEYTKLHPIKSNSFWRTSYYSSKKAHLKIYAADAKILSLLARKPTVGKVKSATLSSKEKSFVEQAVKELPKAVSDKMNKQLIGIYFVQGLPEMGLTEYVLGPDLQPLGALVVLDKSLLGLSASKYATKRARSAFENDGDFGIQVAAGFKGQDGAKEGLQLALLEQFGKVLSVSTQAHPPWDRPAEKPFHPLDYPFSKISWTLDAEGDYMLRKGPRIDYRNAIRFFKHSKRVSQSKIVNTYKVLAKHGFSNIAAIQSPSEDFAQSFATFVHMRLLARPYLVKVSDQSREVLRFTPCWTKPVCAKREKYIQELLR